MSEEVIISEEN